MLIDLCWHLPSGIIDRSYRPSIVDAEIGRIATFDVEITKHTPPPVQARRRLPYRILCGNDTGWLNLVFFNAKADWLARNLPIGQRRIISGRVESFRDALQIVHPDHILTEAEFADMPIIEPIYPLTTGLNAKPLSKAIRNALAVLPDLAEWQEQNWLKKQNWPNWQTALQQAHAPQTMADLLPDTLARQRLAYDELLANQLALALVRARRRAKPGLVLAGTGEKQTELRKILPFSLTPAQEAVIKDITHDMAADKRMLRLLQGDVGSGKTIIAFMAMLAAVESGKQAAIMAPTEILARQHAQTLIPLCDEIGIQAALLTGRHKGKKRNEILADLAQGDIQIIIGTHALFQEDVQFHGLGMIVVDEQHRFGVHQRMTLSAKGQEKQGVDVLVMTATPIPRTLTLAVYGDMDISRLREKLPGRKPIKTRLISLDRIDEVIASLKRLIESGRQAYWVCPLVAESETVDLAAAEARAKMLQKIYGTAVGLIHGQMKNKEKDAVMKQFQDGALAILVATTVVEVGVDIPKASVMIIEHAERFGLSQLHQLRGRVGRGATDSNCLLLYRPPLGDMAQARLKIMRKTEDGFLIAEEDLALRGTGELLGTRQSGLPTFRIADIELHADLLPAIYDDTKLILESDPKLTSERGKALRLLLYLFRRDEAIRYLESG